MAAEIIVADDTADIREFVAAGLRGAGHTVSEAEDGAALLTKLAGPLPDLILLDLQMPVMSGLEVLRRLRAEGVWDDVPVLVLTASGSGEDMVEARKLGAKGYLVKPIRLQDLVDRVERVLTDADLLWIDDLTQSRRG